MPLTIDNDVWKLVNTVHLTDRKDLQSTIDALIREVRAQDARRLELAAEVMQLQADLSTANTTIANQRAAVEQHFRDSRGHNHCIRNNPRLWEAFGLVQPPERLPPQDEFRAGCEAFRTALYAHPERWPDFMSTTKPASYGDYVERYLIDRGWTKLGEDSDYPWRAPGDPDTEWDLNAASLRQRNIDENVT